MSVVRTIGASFLVFFVLVASISAQSEGKNDVKELNATITCEINGEKKSGDECLETLRKFGKIVGYIISGVIISIVFCCCLCWCCICKAIHSNKRSNSQVISRNENGGNPYNGSDNSAIATVA